MAAKDLTTEDGVLSWLQSSTFAEGKNVTKVQRLTEGACGFVYRAYLEGTSRSSVIIKHVESYAARAQNWKLDQNRIVWLLLTWCSGNLTDLASRHSNMRL